MLTKQQKVWLGKLSNTDQVKIVPYNPRVKEVFKKQKLEIQSVLGQDIKVIHKGASAWGISGKGDVDIYVPASSRQFNKYFELLKPKLGEPGSHYLLERVRWNRLDKDMEIEIFLVNENANFWQESLLFWDYIETHPDILEEYKRVKEEAEGTSTREYYTKKVVFINRIMKLIK